MLRLLPLLLVASLASASRYDPDSNRFALRQAATVCNARVVDATGLALLPDTVASITAGLDEGARQAVQAIDAARSLDAAARARAAEMESEAGALDRKLKNLTEPLAELTARAERLAAESSRLKRKIEELPPGEERPGLRALVEEANGALGEAADVLRPAEKLAKLMSERADEMKTAQQDGRRSFVELSSAAVSAIERAGVLPGEAAAAKDLLSAAAADASSPARGRVRERFERLRDVARLLFEAADRACNRADDLRRRSSAFGDASEAFESARSVANPGKAKPALERAQKALDKLRDNLKK